MRTATLIAALGLATLFGVARAAAGGCAVTVSPSPGWPGANVTVTGFGFASGADITVYLGDFPVYDGFIEPDGTFRIGFRIPNPFTVGEVSFVVQDHTNTCGITQPYSLLAEPPEQEPAIEWWGLALLVGAGAVLGLGVAGVVMRRR
jgi:IPT/TIG domain